MNKSDKFYLKQGKLELSMLEEEDERLILSQVGEERLKKEFATDLEFPHTKRLRETSSKTPKLKITQSIYDTLHTMGQFLTQSDVGDPLNPKTAPRMIMPKKTINPTKAQMLEQIASTVKIQELELPPMRAREVEGQPFQPISKEVKQETTISFQESNEALNQEGIDEVLETFFGNISPKDNVAKELKRHIDKQIELIKNYK